MIESVSNFLKEKKRWVVTGAAGFIGSNIAEFLLNHGQEVIAIDNLSTGFEQNIELLSKVAESNKNSVFKFYKLDICEDKLPKNIFNSETHVLHQAALGSVPRSIENPIVSSNSNIMGFLNIIKLAQEQDVCSFVYASSSSVYGDIATKLKQENKLGNPLSPYALTKKINEDFAKIFKKTYGFNSIGLRYFNVFGPRQNPDGAYAAVIPKWLKKMLEHEKVEIYGDGSTSRDFCYIENVIYANIISAMSCKDIEQDVFNIAYGDNTSLNQLFGIIKEELLSRNINYTHEPIYREFRKGDVKESLANLAKSKNLIGYEGIASLKQGMKKTVEYYLNIYGT